MELTVAELVIATGGELVQGDDRSRASSLAIDSRVLEEGAAFVALQGARDGHDFVAHAFTRGARVAFVTRPAPGVDQRHTIVRVDDAFKALADIGREARRRLPETTVVGITGSAGKTSTKDLTVAALSSRRRVHASPGSFNNEAGLPITLFGADLDTQVLVLEQGARFAGNLTELASISRPDIGVVTGIGLAHAEHLGGREGVAQVKGELLEALPVGGLAVLNADDEWTPALAKRTAAGVVLVGLRADPETGVRIADVRVDDELRPTFRLDTPWGSAIVRLALRGAHQARNAGMAAAVALHLGLPFDEVASGLSGATGAAWRMQVDHSPAGVTVVNDAYNASPDALTAALNALGALRGSGRRVAVLGEMRELGEYSAEEHARAGALAAEVGVTLLVVVGDGARQLAAGGRAAGVAEVVEVDDAPEALRALEGRLEPGDMVLVKASRSLGLELVADAIASGRSGEGTNR